MSAERPRTKPTVDAELQVYRQPVQVRTERQESFHVKDFSMEREVQLLGQNVSSFLDLRHLLLISTPCFPPLSQKIPALSLFSFLTTRK